VSPDLNGAVDRLIHEAAHMTATLAEYPLQSEEWGRLYCAVQAYAGALRAVLDLEPESWSQIIQILEVAVRDAGPRQNDRVALKGWEATVVASIRKGLNLS
jgi:hypothetical protein